MHDIVIRHGDVVDGTGAAPRRADVAIDGDRITGVGVVTDRGERELDASGRIVTPGFVDIHTHLDAQLFWDPAASSSCWHGVTTVVLGNCGVTFAPIRPGQEKYLAGMMDSVEDIPADTIMAGLPWGWESYGDYLQALGRRRLGVNVGGMIGHAALRYYVMGLRSQDEAPASEDDIAGRVEALADEALRGRLAKQAEASAGQSGPLAPKDPAKLYLLPPGVARYDVRPQNSLAAEAARRGTTPAGAFLDYSAETGGLGLLYYPVLNSDLDAVGAMLANPDVVIGLGDAGAHVALTMDAGQPSYVLGHWVRDSGRLDIGRAIYKLTLEGAELFGLAGRGRLAPGAYADVNVIDLDGLHQHTPELVADFPLGASRFVQRAHGYDYTLVNGKVLVDHDELTDERPGQLVTAS